jgi:hypothetical protein
MSVLVTTQHGNNERTGANLAETTLNTSNVNVHDFGRLFRRPVKGSIYAQPLYLPAVNVPGKGLHNLVYVATMHNLIYAFDADDPTASNAVWGPISLGTPIALPDPNIGGGAGYRDIAGEVGVLSTPAISPGRSTLYLVAATKEAGVYRHRLHALDVTTGIQKLAPVEISATTPGTGEGGTEIRFRSDKQIQRAALLLLGNKLYVAFAAYADSGPYHGWLLAYDADSLQPKGVFNTTPNGEGAGIWQAGQGPAADDLGVYVMTGNGTSRSDPRDLEFGCAFVEVDPVTLKAVHWFAPTNWQTLDGQDADLGSGGVLLLPGTDLLIGGGKDGRLFLLRRGQLADAADDSRAVDWFQATTARNQGLPTAQFSGGYHHIHGSPVHWKGPMGTWIYLGGEADNLRAYAFNGNGFDHRPASVSTITTPAASMPGAIMSLSANGAEPGTGILWASFPADANANQQVVDGVLHAFDASDLKTVLWDSRQNASRDDVGTFAKFCPPTVADGKVFVGSFVGLSNKVVVPEGATGSPAMATLGDLLVLAWAGRDTDHHLNVESSGDGQTFGSKVTLGDSSPHGPALASGNGWLYLAWTGGDSAGSLNVMSSRDGRSFGNNVTLHEGSPQGPSLAYGNSRLYIAWTGTDGRLNVMSSPDGSTFTNKVTLGESSVAGPAIVFANGKFYLLWAGNDANQSLNVLDSNDGIAWSNKLTLADSSNDHPALVASALNDLYLMWTGRDGDGHINLAVSDRGAVRLQSKQILEDGAQAGPTLVAFKGDTYVGWTGRDTDGHINVARVSAGYLSVYGLLPAPDLLSLTIDPETVIGTAITPPIGTVTLTRPAPPEGAQIVLTSSNPNLASVTGTMTVPAGSTSATFEVTLGQFMSTTVQFTAQYGATQKTATLTTEEVG